MDKELTKIKEEIVKQLAGIRDGQALADLEKKYLGRKGELTRILRALADLSVAEKKTVGRLANEVKTELGRMFAEAKKAVAGAADEAARLDPTLPGAPVEAGRLHPITRIRQELEDLFSSLGFMILDGPELESDYYNFTALNIPPYHPARDLQDTFYIDRPNERGENDLVMRTHTSPMQVRAMEKYGAPLRAVVPGRVFRYEATDTRHDNTFYQLEGIMIDREISVANLIAVMREMLGGIVGRETKIRVRPGYFPFVEPGLEVDMACVICGGSGCASCKHQGWLEMVGSGMVHPAVIRAGGLDPDEWSGFAFGLGIDRLAMMKYGISDIRLFHSGDLRFLKQF